MTYQVTGMTCDHCVRAVTEEIGGMAGVGAVAVDLVPDGVSAVTVTSDAPLTPEAIAAALDEAGAYRLAAGNAETVDPARTLPLV
jgi:copper chaperone CopZ